MLDALRQLARVTGMAGTALWAYRLRSTFVVSAIALGVPTPPSFSVVTSKVGPSASAP
jgi:hypothetical protein